MTDQPSDRREQAPGIIPAPYPQGQPAAPQQRVSPPVFRAAAAQPAQFAPTPAPTTVAPAAPATPAAALDDWADDDVDDAYVVKQDPWASVTQNDGRIDVDDSIGFSDELDPFDEAEAEAEVEVAVPAEVTTEVATEAEADDTAEVDDELDDDETGGDPADRRARPTTPSRRQIARERSQVRRAAQLALSLHAVDEGLRNTVATIVGVQPENTIELVVAIVTANSRDLQVVTDTTTIIDADPLEAGVTAVALGRARLRLVWKLLAGLGILSGDLPSSDAKAALALVRAVHASDTQAARARIDQATSLLRK